MSRFWILTFVLLCLSSMSCQQVFDVQRPKGYELSWSDEFDKGYLDTSKWYYRADSKHQSIQLPENVGVRDGCLVLQLKKYYEPVKGKMAGGAGVVSKRRFRYGYYETRASLGDGVDSDGDGQVDEGWHHAFWAMAAEADKNGMVTTTYPAIRRTEIDIFENPSEDITHFTQHIIVWDENGKEVNRIPPPPRDKTVMKNMKFDQWHVYGCEYTPAFVKFYVDGKLIHTVDYSTDMYTHDWLNVWLTAIAADWNDKDPEPSIAKYDYFRFYGQKKGTKSED